MAIEEGLVLTPPTGGTINLNGSKWGLLELDLGNPPRRDEMVTSLDASGAVPFRVAPKDVREVTAKLELIDAANMNAALDSIGALEVMLESAERLAANGPTDPVAECLRLVYTPANSTQTYSLVVLAAEVTGVPKQMTGDDAGWFTSVPRPIVTIRAICEPFAYGASRVYLDTTTTQQDAPSITVAGGPGDVAPWTRTVVKDVATTARGRLTMGVKRGTGSTTATSSAGAWTAIAGSLNSGFMGSASPFSNDWRTLCAIPRQTRTGSFRVYAQFCSIRVAVLAQPDSSMRLVWQEAGGSQRRNEVVYPGQAVDTIYLGEVHSDQPWDSWIEMRGSISLSGLIFLPVDSYIDVTGSSAGGYLIGSKVVDDALSTTSTHIGGRTMTTGGSWSTVNSASPTWPVSATGASRTANGMTSPAFALAGTGNYMGVDVTVTTTLDGLAAGRGIVARYKDTSNYLRLTVTVTLLQLTKVVGGTETVLWSKQVPDASLLSITLKLQVTADGRWFAKAGPYEASGQDPDLIQGQALGDTGNARVGLYDFRASSTSTATRTWKDFSASSLPAALPQVPIPSGSTLTLSGPRLRNSDNSDYPYVGSSGIELRPGVNNNLTVMAPRLGYNAEATNALDIDIDGYPRFISVPHT